ncbi:MAG: thioredoxin domain-containing protein [Phycisphaerales bacterium]
MATHRASTILHPTARTFEHDVLHSSQPVLVDFWAPWCSPCRMQKPEIERLVGELEGHARIAFVNVDEEPELARQFNVRGIPALMIVKGGRVVDAWTGYTTRPALMARLEAWIDED